MTTRPKVLKDYYKGLTCLNSSLDLYRESLPEPTLPEGTDVKKGESPRMHPSSAHAGGERDRKSVV